MIKVSITSDKTFTPPGISPKTQKPYTFRLQTGYLHEVSVDGEVSEIPSKFEFFVEDGKPAYPRGTYALADSGVYLDRDGKPAVRIILTPLAGKKD
ncbi:MAG: single-stranded DNA-binding protein [Rhodoferax sp.]|nr:single-stranded DNA-binding protein [Rhodoferax sp.]